MAESLAAEALSAIPYYEEALERTLAEQAMEGVSAGDPHAQMCARPTGSRARGATVAAANEGGAPNVCAHQDPLLGALFERAERGSPYARPAIACWVPAWAVGRSPVTLCAAARFERARTVLGSLGPRLASKIGMARS